MDCPIRQTATATPAQPGGLPLTLAGMECLPAPTPEQLCRGTPWCWAVCERCLHRRPVAFVPLIIRWGLDTASDVLRRSACCMKCGRKGALLQHPSWAGIYVGFEPFPR